MKPTHGIRYNNCMSKKSTRRRSPRRKQSTNHIKANRFIAVKEDSTETPQKRSRIRSLFTRIFRMKRLLIGLAAIFVGLIVWVLWGLPLPDKLTQNQAVSTMLLDRNGKLIYEIYADERRTPVALEDIPDTLKKATISIEDKDFYNHSGFSVTGIARAAFKTLTGQRLEGGSTLTQQLVKNSLLTPERTLRRKIREFLLSVLVEVRYSKDEILEMYLNHIPYGSTAYGIEAASQLYFRKSSKDLTLSEATLLAGLPAAPTKFSPFGTTPERAKERQAVVLRRMVEDGHISQEEADQAKDAPITYAQQRDLRAAHFALWVKEQLAEKYGDAVVEQGGLRVTTSLDLDLQEFAQNAVATEVAKLTKQKVGNGAAIVTAPSTGEILAMVGSKDYQAQDEDGKVNIIFAKRQPGSSIKPLNYALAIRDKKITAATPLADIPTCFEVVGQQPYCPVNYDGQFHGATQTRFALGNSYNIPAVRVLALNGLENFVSFARDLGLTTLQDPKNYGLSLTLGGGEVTPFDMATAYGVFANGGIKQNLISILKVEDWKGTVLYESKPEPLTGPRILESDVTFIVNHMIQDNNARVAAFGPSSFLNVRGHSDVSVKTGTTNDRRDNWTIGYTPQAVTIVWVGNNDNSPMSGAVSGVSGASPIWNRIMKEVLDKANKGAYFPKDVIPTTQKQPEGVVGQMICANTGYVVNDASGGCPERFEYFLKDTVPVNGAIRMDLALDRTTQQQAKSDTPPENIEMQNHLVVTDPLGTIICLTCSFPMAQVTLRYPFTERR